MLKYYIFEKNIIELIIILYLRHVLKNKKPYMYTIHSDKLNSYVNIVYITCNFRTSSQVQVG